MEVSIQTHDPYHDLSAQLLNDSSFIDALQQRINPQSSLTQTYSFTK